jgi:hypothetical protein
VMMAIGTIIIMTDVPGIAKLRRDFSAGTQCRPGVVMVQLWGFGAIRAWEAAETEYGAGERSATTAISSQATAATHGARLSVDTAVSGLAPRQILASLERVVTGH